jgi:hypothetical protein
MHYICVTPRRQMRYICVDSPRHYICATFVSATRPGTACVTFVSTRPVEPVQSTTVNDRVRSCNALVTCVYYQVQREYRPRSVDQTRIHASLRGIWNANLRCSSGDFTVCAVFPLCVRWFYCVCGDFTACAVISLRERWFHCACGDCAVGAVISLCMQCFHYVCGDFTVCAVISLRVWWFHCGCGDFTVGAVISLRVRWFHCVCVFLSVNMLCACMHVRQCLYSYGRFLQP